MFYHWHTKVTLFICLQLFIGALQSFAQPVIYNGEYSKIDTSTGEHCSGWTVQLWKTGASFVGMLYHHRGLCGDPPAGILQNLQYNPKDGAISFTSKISDGLSSEGKPSCDMLSFNGRLSDNTLVGVMTWSSVGLSQPQESLNLSREKSTPYNSREYENVAAWLESRSEILKLRGPRC